jgi:F-type H+-transporting ATPase subunit b
VKRRKLEGPLVSATLTTFVFEAANFLILAGVLSWLLFKPVRKALADQRARLQAEASEAGAKLAEAAKKQAEIDATWRKLQDELNQLRARELEAARQKADEILAAARAAAEREREMLRRRAGQLADDAAGRLSQAAAGAATAAVAELLAQIQGPDLDEALLGAACEQLRHLPAERLAPVKVESAGALSPKNRATLEAVLAGAAHEATFVVDESLGSGVRIATASGLIDATAAGLVQFTRQVLAKQLNHTHNNHHFSKAPGTP